MQVCFLGPGLGSGRATAFQHCMYHGAEWRGGARWIRGACHLGSESRDALHLAVNAYRIGEVIAPSCRSLVVSDRIRSGLSHLPGIEFLPVSIDKVIWYPYHVGDDWFYETQCANPPEYLKKLFEDDSERLVGVLEDPSELYTLLEGDTKAQELVGRYFEVLTWELESVAANYQPLTTVDVNLNEIVYAPRAAISAALMMAYPILWSQAGIAASDAAFAILGPHLSPDYFDVRCVNV